MEAQKINSTFSNPRNFTEFGDKLYFRAYDDTNGYELWQLDSTGTATVQDLFLGTYKDSYSNETRPNSSFPLNFTEFGDKLYFGANDGTHGYELWQLDSTGQASLVQDIRPGSKFSFPLNFTEFRDKLYFGANDGTHGYELWQLDSTGQASLVQDLFLGTYEEDYYFNGTRPNSSNPDKFTEFGDKLYFSADDGTNGYELWQLDSTDQASLVQDINTGSEGSYPLNFTEFGDKLYFSAKDGTNDRKLWQLESSGQAFLVQDIRLGSLNYNPYNFTEFGDKLYFSADDGTNGYELWQLDSTGQASLVQNINTGSFYPDGSFPYGSDPRNFTEFGDKLYFSADDGTNGYELWHLDSTGQAFLVQDINPGSFQDINPDSEGYSGTLYPNSSNPHNFTEFGDKLYFSADDGTNGRELWQLDSTGQASLVQDINPGSEGSNPHNFIEFGDKLYFSADDGTGEKLWSIEASSANTAPTVANEISDQITLVGQSFSYQFANNTFDDSDSDTLTYTASLANGQALPPWLAFDADTRTFSSISIPNNTQEKIHQVKVTVSDGTDSVSDIFNIVVANTYVILAGGGNDTVSGGTANDFLLGESGNDSLTGGAGNDVLIGGVGDDFLDGGTGMDHMIGNEGSDLFVLQPNDANNIIYDFSDGSDLLAIDPASFDSASTVAELFDGNGKDLTIAVGSADPLASTVSYDDILLATVIGINDGNLDVNDFTNLNSL